MNNAQIASLATIGGAVGGFGWGVSEGGDTRHNMNMMLNGAAMGGSAGLASAGFRYYNYQNEVRSVLTNKLTADFLLKSGKGFWGV